MVPVGRYGDELPSYCRLIDVFLVSRSSGRMMFTALDRPQVYVAPRQEVMVPVWRAVPVILMVFVSWGAREPSGQAVRPHGREPTITGALNDESAKLKTSTWFLAMFVRYSRSLPG